jgi:hypothetical protein
VPPSPTVEERFSSSVEFNQQLGERPATTEWSHRVGGST